MTEHTIPASSGQLSDREFHDIDAYWRAANYLTIGQIYLLDNPLLREPLRLEHVKPRLLGHWGTSPGLSFIYAHLNRAIRLRDANVIYVCGPGHGGPAMVANTYLEGTYSEFNPDIAMDEQGMRKLFRSFHFPAAYRAMQHRMCPARSMRVASWATRFRTPMARPLTIRILWSPVSWVTARLKRDHWRLRGIPINSSTRRATGRCCRSCI
jgi:hypothetical protein